jgi:hypothetical protein
LPFAAGRFGAFVALPLPVCSAISSDLLSRKRRQLSLPSFPFSSVLFYFCFLRIRCASHIELWLYFHQSSKYGTLHYELFASAMQLQGLFLWLWVSKKGVNSETVRGCLYKCFNVEGPLPVRILYICVVKCTMADMRGSIPCDNHCAINSEDLNASLVG